ncbi:MAG: sigma-E processing peptidase SpoIIGA [Bacteroidales bacterium]|nr:sigma-E processing peptidase SpoIIGA [Clostridium sp.]MCM1202546.1 sigma-E processing peptidase SpoIIGA [Bacteroidales bacterium]
MQITVYLDVVFFINFTVNLFVLWLTGVLLKQKIMIWRVFLAALSGAALLLPCILYPFLLTGITGVALCTGISMGAVAIAYGKKHGGLIKKWFLSTTIMVLLGGIMNYIKSITGIMSLSFSFWLFFMAVSGGLTVFFIYLWKRMVHKERVIYLIKIRHNQNLRFEHLYLDTGNMLWDPLFSKPVIVLSESVIYSVLTDEEREFVEEYRKNGRMNYEKMMLPEIQKRVCFHEIACASVGNLSGKMLCFLIDEITVEDTGRILKRQPVVIGPEGLFNTKRYQGLLHRECI